MNKQTVDVLAAIDRAADAMVDSGRFFKKSEAVVELRAARAAVAELIERLKRLPTYDVVNAPGPGGLIVDQATASVDGNWTKVSDLRAALARIGGGAP